jgi:hypothetical protein
MLKTVMRVGVVVAFLIAPAFLKAQAPAQTKVETFRATTVNLTPGSGEDLEINVVKWASDSEREALLSVLKDKGETAVGPALEKAPAAGYIWASGPVGYTVRYAQKVRLPDGGERVILVTDRPLGSWSREPWKPSAGVAAPAYPFTLVELRLNRQGQGEGKMSLAAKVTADAEAISLENYAAAPVLIDKVRRVPSGT